MPAGGAGRASIREGEPLSSVPSEFTAFFVAILVASLLVIGLLIALPRGANDEEDEEAEAARDARRAREPVDKYALADPAEVRAALTSGRDPAAYRQAVRIVWWVSIAAVLVGVGLSGAFADRQPLIFAVGGAAAVTVVALHELLPSRWRLPGRFWIEAAVAIGLVTALVGLTGYSSSPFAIGYAVVTVGVALGRGGRAAFVFAAVATAAYAGILFLDPAREGFTGDDIVRFGAQIGGLWLLTALAGVYATQERRVRATFLQLSQTDPLTGLFNRSQIFSTLDQEVRRTRRSARGFCVLMIDLDGLKAVNDSFGHHRGDDVLRHLGTVIRRSIRTVDTAYRYGGDEFVVLLPETDIIGAFVVAEKIRVGTEEVSLVLGIEGVEPSVSIGLVSHPEDGLTVEELMIAADRAMYQAKSLGKNQISGYPRVRRAPPSLPSSLFPESAAAPPLPAAEPAPAAQAAIAVEPAPSEPIPVGPAVAAAPEAEPGRARAEAPVAPDEAPPVETAPPPVEVAEPEAEPVTPLEPVEMASAEENGTGPMPSAAAVEDEEEPDPDVVRRQITAATSRSSDPDHQIRRAMDAFLGPAHEPRDRD
jgi:diguanylate cyclase (GGDEF)-like protein